MYKGKYLAQKKKKKDYRKHKGRSRTRRETQQHKKQQLLVASVITAMCVPVVALGWGPITKTLNPTPSAVNSVVTTSAPMESFHTADSQAATEVSFIVSETRALDNAVIRELCHTGTLLTAQDLVEWPDVQKAVQEILTYAAPSGEVVSDVLGKIVTQEIGGLTKTQAYSSIQQEQAAVIWTILNRADNLAGGGTSDLATGEHVFAAATKKNAFAYYRDRDVFDGIPELVEDVICRWVLERYVTVPASTSASGSEQDVIAKTVGRTLSKNYIFFGGDGTHNHFREEFPVTSPKWDWSYVDPYIGIETANVK